MKKATAREEAILFALAAGYIATWKDAYLLSRDKAEAETDADNLNGSIVTRWKQREDINRSYNSALLFLSKRDQATRAQAAKQMQDQRKEEEGSADSNRTQKAKPANLDYYDPANQRTQINKIIQEAQDDPKTQLDAIKAIQQTQRDDRAAARDQKTVQFYRPLRCRDCPLMQKAERKARKG